VQAWFDAIDIGVDSLLIERQWMALSKVPTLDSRCGIRPMKPHRE
jgi:hypothetical protein